MNKYYRDYFWKDGIPYGRDAAHEDLSETTYKIIMDPYRKRISLEQYNNGQFEKIIYDSALVNFRLLTTEEQLAWHKEVLESKGCSMICHIRNQEDRLLFREAYIFEGNLCRLCVSRSPHNIPLYTQRIFYKTLGDDFDGVILYDINDHPVVIKKYVFDQNLEEFTELLEEQWNMESWQKSISFQKI